MRGAWDLAAGVADRRPGRPVAPVGQRAQARFGAGHGEREQERHRQWPHDGKTQLGLAVQLARERHGALARQHEAGAVGAGLPGAGDETTAVEAQPHGNGPRTQSQPVDIDVDGRRAVEALDAQAGRPVAPAFVGDAEQDRRRAAGAGDMVARLDRDPARAIGGEGGRRRVRRSGRQGQRDGERTKLDDVS